MAVPQLLTGAPDYEQQLASLGLQAEYFTNALYAGEQARRLVTKNDPNNAAGTVDYFRRVRTIREGLIAAVAWSRLDFEGLPLVVNPDLTMAIGVLNGDHQTGWVGAYHPRNKRPLGEKKIKLVAQNQQLAMIPRPAVQEEVDVEAADLSKVRTWFFLTNRRVRGGQVIVSSELSEAAEISKENYVTRWARRIPFPDVTFEGVIPYVGGDDEGSDEYEVAVEEK